MTPEERHALRLKRTPQLYPHRLDATYTAKKKEKGAGK